MRRHMPYSTGPCLPAKVGSGAATCLVALNPTFLIGRALVPPCVPWLRTPPPCKGGLRCATCPAALDSTSLQGRAPERFMSYGSRSCLPTRGLQCRHRIPCGFLWATGLKYKEKPSRSVCAARLTCSQCTRACL
jgi:hypothetical protein